MEISTEKIIVVGGILFSFLLGLSVVQMFILFRRKATMMNVKFDIELKNKELEMLNAVVQAQQDERTLIAQNLHDEVGSILSMAHRNVRLTLSNLPNDSPLLEDLEFTSDVLDQSIEKIRSISQGMLPHFLLKFGLLKTLQRLMLHTEKTVGHPCSFTTNLASDVPMPKQQEIHVYYLVLELLNNLIKHGHPQHVDLTFMRNEDRLSVVLNHDGVAISQSDYEHLLNDGDGVGLLSVAHRITLISGEVFYQRNPEGGSIEFSMPYTNTIIEE
ncbi:MAG: hypothetical protein RL362_681 [Bacteroidota bacterium]